MSAEKYYNVSIPSFPLHNNTSFIRRTLSRDNKGLSQHSLSNNLANNIHLNSQVINNNTNHHRDHPQVPSPKGIEDSTTILSSHTGVINNRATDNNKVMDNLHKVVGVIINRDLLKVAITNNSNRYTSSSSLRGITIVIVAWRVLLQCVFVVLLMLFSNSKKFICL